MADGSGDGTSFDDGLRADEPATRRQAENGGTGRLLARNMHSYVPASVVW